MPSVWFMTASLPQFAPLDRDLHTDILIVGGGMAGLLCAYELAQAGADYALIEAGRLCGGTTGNTTAKLTVQHGLVYDKLTREFGAEKARLYLETNLAALHRFEALCRGIDCEFEEKDSFLYSLTDLQPLLREAAALKRLGHPAGLLLGTDAKDLPLPFPVAGALRMARQAQFHPLKFAAAIAQGLHIYEHTKLLELAPGRAKTSGGMVTANKIILATHFPWLNKHGGYFLKLYQSRSYVIALRKPADALNQGTWGLDGVYRDTDPAGLSFRTCKAEDGGELLLLGGGGHRTGKPGRGWRELESFARWHYPDAEIIARWAAQDCMSLDGMPYVGRYSRRTEGLYVASGFNKWGMTGSMAAAGLLADLVLGRKSAAARLFDPGRSILRRQLAANMAESVCGLLTPGAPRCPHLGCKLKYDPHEHSWNCPCHGSRFAEDGTLLNGPATDGIKLKAP